MPVPCGARWPRAAPTAPRRGRRGRAAAAPPPRAGLLDRLLGPPPAAAPPPDALGAALEAHMAARGLPPQPAAPVASRLGGRGLAARGRVAAGGLLLAVPRDLVITPDAALRLSALRPVLEGVGLPAWSVLAAFLAEGAAGAGGAAADAWRPYFAALPPPGAVGNVLEWAPHEVAWLRGSALAAAAGRILRAADATAAELAPLAAAAEARGLVPRGALAPRALRHALALLLSRLVRLAGFDSDGGGAELGDERVVEALVPLADFANHSCDCRSFLRYDAASAAVVATADRAYAAGEEVAICYGERASGELLLSYGFAPPDGANPHDGARVRLPLGGAAAAALRRRGVAELEEDADGGGVEFPLRLGAVPRGFVEAAALGALPAGAGEAEVDAAAAALCAGPAAAGALWRDGLRAAARACSAAVQGYACSVDADVAELRELRAARERAGGGGGESRREAVLRVLVQERRVLSRAAFLLGQQARALKFK